MMQEPVSGRRRQGPSSFGADADDNSGHRTCHAERDGSSDRRPISILNFRDGMTNAPLRRRRRIVYLSTSAGTLSAVGEVVNSRRLGQCRRYYIAAPSLNTPVTSVAVSAVPVGSNVDNAVVQFVRVGLLGPDVPEGSFTFTPTPVTVGQAATFDASGTLLWTASP